MNGTRVSIESAKIHLWRLFYSSVVSVSVFFEWRIEKPTVRWSFKSYFFTALVWFFLFLYWLIKARVHIILHVVSVYLDVVDFFVVNIFKEPGNTYQILSRRCEIFYLLWRFFSYVYCLAYMKLSGFFLIFYDKYNFFWSLSKKSILKFVECTNDCNFFCCYILTDCTFTFIVIVVWSQI